MIRNLPASAVHQPYEVEIGDYIGLAEPSTCIMPAVHQPYEVKIRDCVAPAKPSICVMPALQRFETEARGVIGGLTYV